MTRPFRFKQFEVHHDRCAMKVGTDGILLGAWACTGKPKSILDIGAGCGLIAMMLAQRFESAKITAVEICPDAAQQARHNFRECPWPHRLQLIEGDARSLPFSGPFDLVVANPPYFSDSLLPAQVSRAAARHTGSLTFADVVSATARSRGQQGQLAVIIPTQRVEEFCQEAEHAGLQLTRRCEVQPSPHKPPVRSLLEFQQVTNAACRLPVTEMLLLESSRHNYSDKYRQLTEDFYLKH